MRQLVLLKDIPDLTEITIDNERRPKIEGVKTKISDLDKRALRQLFKLKIKLEEKSLYFQWVMKKLRRPC